MTRASTSLPLVICDDLREWIDLLGREGELVEVAAEVDPHLEISEIADRVVKARRARAALPQRARLARCRC